MNTKTETREEEAARMAKHHADALEFVFDAIFRPKANVYADVPEPEAPETQA